MRWEYHVAAVGGEASDVAVDLVDVLNALGAQGWELATRCRSGTRTRRSCSCAERSATRRHGSV